MYQQLLALEEDVFKVIANQKRLEIIQLLYKGELNVSEMVSMLGIRQSNLSQHLSLLRQHKIVVVTRKGREVYYKLSDKNIAKAVELIHKFLQKQHQVESHGSLDNLFPIVIDPVCEMRISASEAFDSREYERTNYYFCASGCVRKFSANPHKFLSPSRKETLVIGE